MMSKQSRKEYAKEVGIKYLRQVKKKKQSDWMIWFLLRDITESMLPENFLLIISSGRKLQKSKEKRLTIQR